MKKIGILLLSIITLLMMFGGTGCMNFENTNLIDKMVENISQRYDDQFEYAGPFGGGAGATEKQIIVSSRKYPDAEIIVSYSYKTGKYYDNYLSYVYEQQTIELLSEILSERFGDNFFLHHKAGKAMNVENTSDSTTFNEYISKPGSSISFSTIIYLPELIDDKDEVINYIYNALKNENMCCFGNMYFTSDKERFDEITEDNFKRLIDDKCYYNNWAFIINGNMELTYSEWR